MPVDISSYPSGDLYTSQADEDMIPDHQASAWEHRLMKPGSTIWLGFQKQRPQCQVGFWKKGMPALRLSCKKTTCWEWRCTT